LGIQRAVVENQTFALSISGRYYLILRRGSTSPRILFRLFSDAASKRKTITGCVLEERTIAHPSAKGMRIPSISTMPGVF
jgi:hypothetical protein